MAIASQLKEADGLEVRIKADFNKLAHGQLDSLAIAIFGVLLQPNLEAEYFSTLFWREGTKRSKNSIFIWLKIL